MSSVPIRTLTKDEYPKQLLEIPQPPEQLYIRGKLPQPESLFLAVVGSRKYTSYGKEACEKIISNLSTSDVNGMAIVSGLALGIDSIAHRVALDAGLKTIAIPGSGLDPKVLYPSTNRGLAENIVNSGGALISEFPDMFQATPYAFPQRNRLMAGIARGVLVVEAGERSGTLITARLALEYNRDVFVVPGSIFSTNTRGSNWLLKQGAIPVTDARDILEHWGIENGIMNNELGVKKIDELLKVCSPQECRVIDLLNEPLSKDELIRKINLPVHEINVLLSSMEIKGIIKESLGEVRLVF